ncbi:MAG TPA: methyl-accepting chemotaxis protein [Albitalea sp.]|nr:methyl-accepting chemotaxis protein [Albitalea sp.]
MNVLTSLRIRTRLAVLAGVLLLLVVIVAAMGLVGLRHLTRQFESAYAHQTVPLSKLGLAIDTIYRSRTRLTLGMEAQYKNTSLEHFAAMEKLDAEALLLLKSVFDEIRDDAGRAQVAIFEKNWPEYVKVRTGVIKSYQEGDRATAVSEFRMNALPPFEAAIGAADTLLKTRVEASEGAMQAASATATEITGATLIVVAVGLLLVVGLSFVIITSIVRPLAAAVHAARTIACGDLGSVIESQGADETAQLLRAMADMQMRLADLVREVRDGVESMSGATTEIASGNLDLSSRTERQASSLQETAASLDQMTGALRQHTDTSRQAEQLAMRASDVATKGGAAVGQVVDTMNEIQSSSRKISDIIGVIDAIAFQTNILALNAAVEAARAGDQGRGFAVVAGEVRALAQRSAEAAREIKGLIAGSVERVDEGSSLVNVAGATMNDIVTQVRQVRDLIGELTRATADQSNGIARVNESVGRIDEMTQQNSALVEQSAGAAESLKEQAARLAQAVAVFRLPEGAAT